jgi:hypothetical protein
MSRRLRRRIRRSRGVRRSFNGIIAKYGVCIRREARRYSGVTAAFGRRLVVLYVSGMDVSETVKVTISRLPIAYLATSTNNIPSS